MEVFRRIHKVRFASTDYAGLIFYPRYFEMLNAVVEDWFSDALNVPFHELLDTYELGSPLVNVETEFIAPCLIGEDLTFELVVESLGKASVTICVETRCGSELRVRAKMTHVCIKRDPIGATAWPSDVSDKMRNFLKVETQNA